MFVKLLIGLILFLILTIVILILIIKFKNKKIDDLRFDIEDIESELDDYKSKNDFLIKELKIESEHSKKIAEKLAEIFDMSIDDVLNELQNNKNG